MRRPMIAVLAALVAMSLASGCTGAREPERPRSGGGGTEAPQTSDAPAPEWLAARLTDVVTGEAFTLGDLKGTPVLLEMFAVW